MIYLLEDDDNIRNFVTYALCQSGLETKGFDLPSAFWTAVAEAKPSMAILDIMLPEEDGLSVLKKLRENPNTARLPIMMLTAKGTEYDKVLGLDCGADDYVSKPFGTMELIARVKALLRRAEAVSEGANAAAYGKGIGNLNVSGNSGGGISGSGLGTAKAASKEYHIGSLYLNPDKHIIRVNDDNVSLTLKEFRLLCFLVENEGCVMTRDAILREVWGYEFDGENRTVDVHIRTLRSKLGEAENLIETVRGIGYRLGNGSGN